MHITFTEIASETRRSELGERNAVESGWGGVKGMVWCVCVCVCVGGGGNIVTKKSERIRKYPGRFGRRTPNRRQVERFPERPLLVYVRHRRVT